MGGIKWTVNNNFIIEGPKLKEIGLLKTAWFQILMQCSVETVRFVKKRLVKKILKTCKRGTIV